MKKIAVLLLVAVLTLGVAACSCNEVEPTSSVQSVFTPSASSEAESQTSSVIGDNFIRTKFGVNGVTTSDWVSFKTASPKVSYQFTLPVPPTWTAASGSESLDGSYRGETAFLDSANRTIMMVKAPVELKDGQEIPTTPGEGSTAFGGSIISSVDVMLDSGARGKLVTRSISADGGEATLYQYYINSADNVVYRADFYLYSNPSDANDALSVFNYIMSELHNSSDKL